ncbi:hypothetical protein BU24DRAFT_416679 [Aaosphaeria arxii CBS 175.79]|uniref:Uncharacterized protein n=1 Tax=Aaosphaeria arxii CBS 175.79 TaxID=1450172 RepID=A0A6A5Y8U8_9PLEO|nr:uncharacterized protein BU24DRAFT_416679 [Aaosphaeria arxii CBS 175.79]KAF2021004.1 hypothetical protein BU24DRAFT_416679 [Aaosphaeria arxii CBS 175.79]
MRRDVPTRSARLAQSRVQYRALALELCKVDGSCVDDIVDSVNLSDRCQWIRNIVQMSLIHCLKSMNVQHVLKKESTA